MSETTDTGENVQNSSLLLYKWKTIIYNLWDEPDLTAEPEPQLSNKLHLCLFSLDLASRRPRNNTIQPPPAPSTKAKSTLNFLN